MTAEEYIKLHTRSRSNQTDWDISTFDKEIRYYHRWLTPDDAINAVKIAKEETIEKACEFFYHRMNDVGDVEFGNIENFINDFKKYLEDK